MIINIKQNTSEWLEYRASKFNASETAILFNVGFEKPYQLAQYKYSNVAKFKNVAMEKGQEYEPKIRAEIENQYQIKLPAVVMAWDKDERFSASLDGFNAENNVICEIKFSRNEFDFLKMYNRPSEKYEIQIQHQLMVSGANSCIFAVGCVDDDFKLDILSIELKPRPEFWAEIVEKWEQFEKEYKNEQIDSEFMDIQWELTHLCDEVKVRENRIKELKSRLIEKANGKEMKFANITIYKTIRKATYDYKAFCDSQGLKPSDDFLKDGSEFWAVKVN